MNETNNLFKNKKLLALVFVSFLLAIMMVSYFPKEFLEEKRNLITYDQYKNLCVSNKTSNILGFDMKLNISSIFIETLNSIGTYSVDSEQYIQKAIDGDTNQLLNLAHKLFLPFYIILGFVAISFIMWMSFCICNCSQKCCCSVKETVEPEVGCRFFSLIVFCISIVGIGIICCIGFSFADRFVNNLNEFECSLLTFYTDAKFGMTRPYSPRFIGYDKISDFIEKVKDTYIEIENQYRIVFKTIDWVESDRYSFIDSINSIYEASKYKKVQDMNYNKDQNLITPDFIFQLGPFTKENTYFNNLMIEYDKKLSRSAFLVNNTREAFDNFVKSDLNSVEFLNNLTKNFLNSFEFLKEIETNYITPFQKYKDQGSYRLNIILLSIFAGNFLFSLFFLSFAIMFVKCNSIKMKLVTDILWNLMFLVTIILFALSASIGAIGISFIYVVPTTKLVFSKKNLPKLSKNQIATDVVNLCLNEGGDLNKLFIGNNIYIKHFEKIYQNTLEVNKIFSQIQEEKLNSNNLLVIKEAFGIRSKDLSANIESSNLVGILLNHTMKTSFTDQVNNSILKEKTEGSAALDKLNLYSDYNIEGTKQKNCKTNLKDNFISSDDQTKCKKSYKWIDSNIAHSNLGKSSCLEILNWSKAKLNERLKSFNDECQLEKDEFINLKEAIYSLSESIFLYNRDCNQILSSLSAQFDG